MTCHQGQTHGHKGFLLTPTQSSFFVAQQIINQEVIFPFLILQQAHDRLDQTVALAYGIEPETEPLQFLLNLNLQVTAKEANGETITPPGLPDFVSNRADFISPDCVSMNE